MENAKKRMARIKATVSSGEVKFGPRRCKDKKELKEDLDAIDEMIPEFPKGVRVYGCVYLFVEEDGKRLGFLYKRDVSITDRQLSMAMLDAAASIMSDKSGEAGAKA